MELIIVSEAMFVHVITAVDTMTLRNSGLMIKSTSTEDS
jgi:hypothetical protein